MKKLLLFVSPLIFLVACSSGGGDAPLPQNDVTGVWELTELQLDGTDLMPSISQALYYYHPNGMYEAKVWGTDGSYTNAIGTYSTSNDLTVSTTNVVTLGGGNYGLYQSGSAALTFVNENEVTTSSSSVPCIGGVSFGRMVKTTNSLGTAPSMPIIGAWRVTEVNHAINTLEDKVYDNIYLYDDGSYREEILFTDGSTQITIGSYQISSDQTSLTLLDPDVGVPLSGTIDTWEIDEVEISNPDLLGTGPYSMKMERIECSLL